ncbi:uncharacterized protein L969DRAFT_94070 [Mixia osmundae IAM 14324]|uniref:O-acyltransferase n=1 Tax=Mixia osmundae (strain CBS 9802 / IAM 14324 / JCM 22182 / KY 12970) TaxID=764103 RepID=G7E901_MIXOS|nr:uncharacterized protein L969DRAFT_94070 [Mixia osmundae IAM 14324]KEI40255.1 hypothetical protein L969DRAFT_94070 [Mixia osmundae IAM 14324]GAA99619.1 hypothetical protein E5Q_06320 [Mixia osmundae IAM 14324]
MVRSEHGFSRFDQQGDRRQLGVCDRGSLRILQDRGPEVVSKLCLQRLSAGLQGRFGGIRHRQEKFFWSARADVSQSAPYTGATPSRRTKVSAELLTSRLYRDIRHLPSRRIAAQEHHCVMLGTMQRPTESFPTEDESANVSRPRFDTMASQRVLLQKEMGAMEGTPGVVPTGLPRPRQNRSMTNGSMSSAGSEGDSMEATTFVTTKTPGQRQTKRGDVPFPSNAIAPNNDSPPRQTSGRNKTTETQTTRIVHSDATHVESQVHGDGSVTLKPVASVSSRGRQRRPRVKHIAVSTATHFDRQNASYAADPFRGFYVLFWLLIFIAAIRTLYTSYITSGVAVSLRFAALFSEDAKVLALSDAVMVTSTFLCVPFVKMMKRDWIRYYGLGMVIQHLVQAAFLFAAVRWTFYRNWPWVQSGFMTLHSLVMLMKIHSYCATNGQLSANVLTLKTLRPRLSELLEQSGGLEKAMSLSREEKGKASLDGQDNADASGVEKPQNGSLTRRKRTISANEASKSNDVANGNGALNGAAHPASGSSDIDYSLLESHPDTKLSGLASEIVDLQDSLVSQEKHQTCWPHNITYANYLDYLLVPVLVYELEYPRTNRIRYSYVVEKVLGTLGTFSILYLITEHYVMPLTEADSTVLGMALDLAPPFMLNYLLLFYIIFECICNAFAELTYYADRGFYEDWWNAREFGEFSRAWNKPVHHFLLRHVYKPFLGFGMSKFVAGSMTFLLSACMHELVMAVVSKKIRFYIFGSQMSQLPLIMIGQLPVFKRYPTLGNAFFWLGLMAGFPLLAVGYLRY